MIDLKHTMELSELNQVNIDNRTKKHLRIRG